MLGIALEVLCEPDRPEITSNSWLLVIFTSVVPLDRYIHPGHVRQELAAEQLRASTASRWRPRAVQCGG